MKDIQTYARDHWFRAWLVMMIFIGAVAAGSGLAEAGDDPVGTWETLQLDLGEAVALGLARNHRIHAADYEIERIRSDVRSVRGRFLPSLSAGYNWNHVDNHKARGQEDPDYLDQTQETFRVSLQQTVYAGGTVLNTYRKAKIQEEASILEKEGEERQLIRKIQEQFLLLLKAREDMRSLEQTVERLKVSMAAAESFAARQLLPYVEVLQARVELEEARQKLGQARNQVNIYEAQLNALLDLEGRFDVFYAGDLADIDLSRSFDMEKTVENALKNRTDLKYLEKRIEMSEKEKSIALGRKLPRVTLDVSGIDRTREYDQPGTNMFGQTFDRDQRNQYWTAGVSVDWQFFSGGENYYRRQGMDNEVNRFRRLYADRESIIRTEVRSAYLRLVEAKDRVAATRSNLETAREGFRMEQERLERRVGTLQALLNAQDRLTRADTGKNQAMLDYQLALADLYYAMGVRNYALN